MASHICGNGGNSSVAASCGPHGWRKALSRKPPPPCHPRTAARGLTPGDVSGGWVGPVHASRVGGASSAPAERAIARITGVFLRTGAKYAAVISQDDEHNEHPPHDRAIAPVREAITRGIRNGELRADLPDGALFAMYDALIGRALVLTITGKLTPEQAEDSVVSVFLNGAAV